MTAPHSALRTPRLLRGLYAITPASLCRNPSALHHAVNAALAGGAALIQYRDKESSSGTRRQIADRLAEICARHGAVLIINDDVALAAELGAGVHLGRNDMRVDRARGTLGPEAIIGGSCSASLERAQEIQQQGASYAGFGRFFPSRTKPDAPAAPIAVLGEARGVLQIPICAIGGVTPENAKELVDAGADMVAAVEGVFAAQDVEAAARAISRLFPPYLSS